MSPSTRTGCGNATATGLKTWRCSTGWPCHCCVRIERSRRGSNASAKPRAGTTIISSICCSIVSNPSALTVGDARGQSFSVHLEQHVFHCFARECGRQGDVLDLWAGVHGMSLRDAALDLVRTFDLEPAPPRTEKRHG